MLFVFWGLISIDGFALNKLEFAVVEKSAPMAFIDKGEIKGIAVDVLRILQKRIGFEANIQIMPFKRSLRALVTGEIDATAQIYKYKEREQFVIFTELPTYWAKHYVFVKKGKEFDFKSGSLQSLYGKRVGKDRGYFISEEFIQAVREGRIDLDEAQHTGLNLNKLLRNRIDCYISNYYIAAYSITRLGYQGRIVHLPEPLLKKKGTYMAISRKSVNIKDKQGFISRMNEELKDMHDSGLIMQIINTYIETPPN